MRTGIARSLLLILLLTLTGQALAAPCASGTADMAMSTSGDHHSHGAPDADDGHETGFAGCAPAGSGCTGSADHSGHLDECNCCPSHCNSLLPAGDFITTALPGHAPATAYRASNTAPDPETALRPPISR